MSSAPSRPPRLRIVTREIAPIDDLLEYADPADPLVWTRRGSWLVGVGSALTLTAPAADAATLADRWREVAANAVVDDHLEQPGSGLVAFGALPFDVRSASSAVLTVPRLTVGSREGRTWASWVLPDDGAPEPDEPRAIPYGRHWSAAVGPGALTPDGYQDAVRAGLAAIAQGEVSKVVLARDLAGTVPAGSDLRRLVRSLASSYPDTWVYAVDGLIGASPETLVTVSGGQVTARVLAGTVARGAGPDADREAALRLATSAKDLAEHQYAVRSLVDALSPHATALAAAEQPFTLALPNVWHLATDVEATISTETSALDLLGVLHPTAAVAGTPTAAALDAIRRIEPFDRGRYAGPVGWVDAHGDGEWAIALRGAQFDLAVADGAGIPFRAHAGAGIVAGSDPEAEMLETRVKFRPIVDALA
ncbi:chorismate-binding protein [Microbacterium sp. VKM Ac-2870]|uniref:isochorismate synthase n=1 Tax=Microbacterium sp. VKM Ac-2870 TaxID=2783825 RepID=UPI00188D028D|nr:isochorismate synthase [Microbacterium sp. VKM Ac-2870]MBF4561978.1 chorismate-binding protein [Microbacterium sp. VKM Ac-2870]